MNTLKVISCVVSLAQNNILPTCNTDDAAYLHLHRHYFFWFYFNNQIDC